MERKLAVIYDERENCYYLVDNNLIDKTMFSKTFNEYGQLQGDVTDFDEENPDYEVVALTHWNGRNWISIILEDEYASDTGYLYYDPDDDIFDRAKDFEALFEKALEKGLDTSKPYSCVIIKEENKFWKVEASAYSNHFEIAKFTLVDENGNEIESCY